MTKTNTAVEVAPALLSKRDHILALAVEARALNVGVLFFGARYAYVGIPVEVGDGFVVLENARMPFETGEFSSKEYKNIEDMPHGRWTVQLDGTESFGVFK